MCLTLSFHHLQFIELFSKYYLHVLKQLELQEWFFRDIYLGSGAHSTRHDIISLSENLYMTSSGSRPRGIFYKHTSLVICFSIADSGTLVENRVASCWRLNNLSINMIFVLKTVEKLKSKCE